MKYRGGVKDIENFPREAVQIIHFNTEEDCVIYLFFVCFSA